MNGITYICPWYSQHAPYPPLLYLSLVTPISLSLEPKMTMTVWWLFSPYLISRAYTLFDQNYYLR